MRGKMLDYHLAATAFVREHGQTLLPSVRLRADEAHDPPTGTALQWDMSGFKYNIYTKGRATHGVPHSLIPTPAWRDCTFSKGFI